MPNDCGGSVIELPCVSTAAPNKSSTLVTLFLPFIFAYWEKGELESDDRMYSTLLAVLQLRCA